MIYLGKYWMMSLCFKRSLAHGRGGHYWLRFCSGETGYARTWTTGTSPAHSSFCKNINKYQWSRHQLVSYLLEDKEDISGTTKMNGSGFFFLLCSHLVGLPSSQVYLRLRQKGETPRYSLTMPVMYTSSIQRVGTSSVAWNLKNYENRAEILVFYSLRNNLENNEVSKNMFH